jgi:hypothetical protein
VSSTYRVICASHDPALVLDSPEWTDPDGMVGALRGRRNGGVLLAEHRDCTLLGGRYSYPLIAVYSDDSGHWIDVELLRLLLAVHDAPERVDAVLQALGAVERWWPRQLVLRLRPHLEER